MNKKQKIKRLTWKYFIIQKLEEIGKGLIYFLGAIGIITLFAHVTYFFGRKGEFLNINESIYDFGGFVCWAFVGIIFLFILISGIFMIMCVIKLWFNNNWKKAEERAKKEVKKR